MNTGGYLVLRGGPLGSRNSEPFFSRKHLRSGLRLFSSPLFVPTPTPREAKEGSHYVSCCVPPEQPGTAEILGMFLEMGHEKAGENGGKRSAEDTLVPVLITDRGKERDVNEDRCSVIQTLSGTCTVVFDGMGGVEGGDFAAQLALEAFQRFFLEHPTLPPEAALQGAVEEAHRVIKLRRQNQTFVSMGSTVVAVLIDGGEVVVANVGDSRAYLVREGNTEQLSIDHTLVQDLVDRHEIRKEDALTHPQSHILTQCLGSAGGIALTLRRFWIWPPEEEGGSDKILLCSDGLYSLIPDEEIALMVSTHSPEESCSLFVNIANERGGYDNITAAIVPLDGLLRDEPPPEWERQVVRRARQKEMIANNQAKLSTHFMFSLVVSMVAFAATCILFMLVNFWGR